MSALTSKTVSSRAPLAAEGEELARQRRGALDGLQDLGQILLRHLVRQLGLDEARVAGDDGQQVVESCATPLDIRPMISIFCAWRSCASSSRRSVTSMNAPISRPGCPWASLVTRPAHRCRAPRRSTTSP